MDCSGRPSQVIIWLSESKHRLLSIRDMIAKPNRVLMQRSLSILRRRIPNFMKLVRVLWVSLSRVTRGMFELLYITGAYSVDSSLYLRWNSLKHYSGHWSRHLSSSVSILLDSKELLGALSDLYSGSFIHPKYQHPNSNLVFPVFLLMVVGERSSSRLRPLHDNFKQSENLRRSPILIEWSRNSF